MCLYTKMVKNPKYKKNKKNGGVVPKCDDPRKMYIPAECGECIECRKKKSREWGIRLNFELNKDKDAQFVTWTFSEEGINRIVQKARKKGIEIKDRNGNEMATMAVRWCLERWRAKEGRSPKHWLITELGHKGTERIHIHGIVWTKLNNDEIKKIWKYGHTHVGYSMNERVINYVVKYITKRDNDHPEFKGKMFPSPGLARDFIETWDARLNEFKGKDTVEYMRTPKGGKTAMPKYIRNKRYTEEEREELWVNKLDKNEIYVMGKAIKNIDTKKGQRELKAALEYARRVSNQKGYRGGEGKKELIIKENVETFGS